jgi:RNA polymerase sigma-70 factor (ECF subfamily)
MRHTTQEVLTEPDLLQRAQRYEGKALAEIYDTYSPELYNYAYRQLGNPTQAEECVAETFKRLLEALSQRKGPRDHIRAYLYRIAHNWITDQYRRQPLPDVSLEDQMISDPGPSPSQATADNMERERLREALMKLNTNQRLVVALKYLEGWSSPEIAKALDRPLEAVKGLLHRGIENLRLHLTDETNTQEEE